MNKGKLATTILIGSMFFCSFQANVNADVRQINKYESFLQEEFIRKADIILNRAQELKLSKKQEQEIRNLKLKVEKDLIIKEAEITIFFMDIEAELKKDKLYVNAINSFIDKRCECVKSMEKFLIEAFSSLNSLLTDGQKKKLSSNE